MSERAAPISSLDRALSRVGDRWSLLLVESLRRAPLRFSELSEQVSGVAPNILTARLRRLEADGILTAVRYQDRPARFRYELTEIGQQLGDALDVLASWGARHAGAERTQDAAFHPPCGTALESRPWCPTCERIPAQDEVIWL